LSEPIYWAEITCYILFFNLPINSCCFNPELRGTGVGLGPFSQQKANENKAEVNMLICLIIFIAVKFIKYGNK